MPRLLTNITVDEVSSVTAGAGKGVKVLLMKRAHPYTVEKGELSDDVLTYLKREFSADERQAAADSGAALPDGSFPIKNKQDLHNAIQAIGRAKNRARAMAHIKSRAKALGATDMLPDSWSKRDTATVDKALTLALGALASEGGNTDDYVRLFKQFHDFLSEGSDDMTLDLSKQDLTALIAETVGKAFTDFGLVEKMTPDHAAYARNLDGDEKTHFSSMRNVERDKYMKENPLSSKDTPNEDGDTDSGEGETPDQTGGNDSAENKGKTKKRDTTVSKAEQVLKSENEELKKRLGALEEINKRAEFAKRAEDLGLPASKGEMLLKVHRGDPDAIKEMEQMIKAAVAQDQASSLFKSFGMDGGAPGSAHDELVAKAGEIRKADPKITAEAAYVKAMEAYPEIAKREKAERDARIQKIAA